MKFKWIRNGAMRCQDGEIGPVIELDIYHNKGGMNYFNYKTEPRGIYLSLAGVTIEKHENGIMSRAFNLFGSGKKWLVVELPRKSDKQIERVAAKFEPHAERIMAEWKSDQPKAAELIASLIAELKGAS